MPETTPLTKEERSDLVRRLSRLPWEDAHWILELFASLEAQLAQVRAQHVDMLRALQLVESVYRQNVVAAGEPSSVLSELQRVIALATGTPPAPKEQ